MPDFLRILVTKAASPTAYHLLPMLASCDITQGQRIELILCDCIDAQEDLTGVAMELKDCAFPTLTSVILTSNFCEACKSADVIIVLPSTGSNGNKEVEISYSSLNQVDFSSLDTVMHPTVVSKTETAKVHCRGPMSTACAIANCMTQIITDSVKAIEREIEARHEEAEFGCPPDPTIEDIILTHCDYHFGAISIGARTLVVFVSSSDVNDIECMDEDNFEDNQIYTQVYARL
ncbi:uncharacterized protein LOC123535196 [Mercenaria mercenaria]|uniref:uncharacterized protein LOC123535196 n=1 Tax=Mercenaria mercenaria TaxID=6596 RepID=UPI00234EE03A|nr:uncharacterized protein LOC123535196 [Mercenaria mercenaria]